MKKNYNFNYVNRTAKPKTDIDFSNVESANCLKSVLKKSPIVEGRLWHTVDTNEFFYDWNGNRAKLNLTGDSESVATEINKIKSDVAKLNPDTIDAKVNSAISQANAAVASVNNITSTVNEAVADAQAATQAANEAAAAVNDKVSQSELQEAISDKVSQSELQEAISQNPGPKGEDGKDGVDGQNGQDGKDGADGKSAYAIAVEHGFSGTEEEWLSSLVGVDGKDGKDGADGQNGQDGQPGADGHDGKDGADGQDGKSAYEIAVEHGFQGSEVEWLESLKGKDGESGASDFETGVFPSGVDVENASADENGIATVQDVMDYVRSYFEKKKDELEPEGSEFPVAVPYLYTNGYKIGDPAIELDDPLNGYEIVLDGNGQFEIELLHKNEEDGYVDPDDITESEPGKFFKVILPTGYNMDVYVWDEENSEYYSTPANVSAPGYVLEAYDVTPDNTTYYYHDVVEKYLWLGGKQVEGYVNLYNHLIKIVVTKNN